MSCLAWQQHLAGSIRDIDATILPPGVTAERMAIYRSLFHTNIESFLSGGFPVLRGVVSEARWQTLVRAFVRDHRSKTPYFHQLGRAFIDWLQQGYKSDPDDPPFLLELAHYERVELELEISAAELPRRGWSELALPLAYVWPVHRLGKDWQPSAPTGAPTCLLAWRDRNDRVRFMELTPFAYLLALRLQGGESDGVAVRAFAAEVAIDARDDFLDGAKRLLHSWHERDIYVPGDEL